MPEVGKRILCLSHRVLSSFYVLSIIRSTLTFTESKGTPRAPLRSLGLFVGGQRADKGRWFKSAMAASLCSSPGMSRRQEEEERGKKSEEGLEKIESSCCILDESSMSSTSSKLTNVLVFPNLFFAGQSYIVVENRKRLGQGGNSRS